MPGEGCKELHNPTENGQHHSRGIREQLRRNSVQTPSLPCQGPVDVVSAEGHSSSRSASPRLSKRDGGREILSPIQSDRLDVESKDFYRVEQEEGPTTGGSLCLPPDGPTPCVLQSPSRPIGSGDGCFPPGLVQGMGICQSPMVPNR